MKNVPRPKFAMGDVVFIEHNDYMLMGKVIDAEYNGVFWRYTVFNGSKHFFVVEDEIKNYFDLEEVKTEE